MSFPEKIGRITDEAMACAELEQDLLFHKIPKEKLPYYVSASLDRGRKAASAFQGQGIRALCRTEGLRYEVTDRTGTFHNLSFRAQIDFAKDKPEIIIYSASLRGMKQAYLDTFGSTPDKGEMDRLVDIHLAHEFYHYLEFKSGRFTNEELEPVEVFRLGSLYTKRSGVAKTSEIAAHAFCKELLRLPCLPNLIDYVYLIGRGELSEQQFESRLREWQSWL
ncbi:hypothetical protein XI25_09015 [Paenibacillus sp. DMB20]|nr:hypothetical protein XI25_09015 [Paenibacillus sp. DMB20]